MPEIPIDVSLHELLDQREWLARLAAALVKDPHSADDAAQQTWLHALTLRTPLREGRAWLSAVLGNVVRQRHRADARRSAREQTVAAGRTDVDATAAEANERFETQRAVAAAVQALDEPFRTTVLLHHFEGMSLAAIARSQHVPAGTVRWRLHRAHELLRETLSERLGRDEWRRALGALCVPLRRSAMLVAAVPLLLAAGLATTAIVWAASSVAYEPPAASTGVASAASDTSRDEQPVERALARGIADAPAPDAATPPKPSAGADQSAMVRARIAGSDGAPLGNATLRLADVWLGGQKAPAGLVAMLVPAASAGADGRVALAIRAPGEMLALAGVTLSSEFVARATVVASADAHADESVEVHLGNGDDRDLGTLTLTATGAVSGRVVDAQGSPAADARVCVLRPPFPRFCDALAANQHSPDTKPSSSVDAGTGAFELAGVRTGPAIVWASKPGFASAWQFVDVAGAHTRCEDLVLRAGTPVPPAPPAHEQPPLHVVVVDGDGAPVQGARVAYRQWLASGMHSSGSLLTNANGRATLPTHTSDAIGRDTIQALELAATSSRPELGGVFVPKPVAIADEVRIVLPAASPLEVRAVGEGGAALPAFTVSCDLDEPAFGEIAVDGKGGVAMLPAPAARATLTVLADRHAPLRVPFVPGETTSPLAVTLQPQRGVSVLVTARGKPLADAIVSLVRGDEVQLRNGFRSTGEVVGKWGATGKDGRFRIDHGRADLLRVHVTADGYAPSFSEPHDYDPSLGWDDVVVELGAGGAIEGVVRDRTGIVVPRALVVVNDFRGNARTVFADASGRFRCDHLRAGGYEVRVTNRTLDAGWSSTLSLPGPIASTLPHPDCDVKDGEVTRFDLIVDRCRVAGTLLATGFGARAWRATLVRAHDGVATCKDATLGDDGAFVLSSSSDGPHELQLTAAGGPLGNVTVFVRLDLVAGDNTIDVPLALAPLAGRADGASGAPDRAWTYLKQESPQRRVLTYVHVDPTTLRFTAPLAPVGDNVLVAGTNAGDKREVGTFVVAPR